MYEVYHQESAPIIDPFFIRIIGRHLLVAGFRPEFENSVGVDSTRVLALAREENISTKKREANDLDVFNKLQNENEELKLRN